MNQHFEENKTIYKARQLGEWKNMEHDVIKYVKKCPMCQLQKTTRVKRKAEAIIPDIPIDPNEKIAMDIFVPLPVTTSGYEYTCILSVQDQLTKYLMLIPLKKADLESIIEGLFYHDVYIF